MNKYNYCNWLCYLCKKYSFFFSEVDLFEFEFHSDVYLFFMLTDEKKYTVLFIYSVYQSKIVFLTEACYGKNYVLQYLLNFNQPIYKTILVWWPNNWTIFKNWSCTIVYIYMYQSYNIRRVIWITREIKPRVYEIFWLIKSICLLREKFKS